ncbi:MAG: hypothetical protein KGN34_17235 [Sphingomonadales bacterium]|nr:hypothetical protein [Sphingomonadales bacterium]
MRGTLATALLLLAACDKTSPEEQARRDARDIAFVEGAQRSLPPPMPLVPQGVGREVLPEAGCTVSDPAHAAGQPILLTGPTRAVMRVAGHTEVLASDPGSSRLPGGTWSRYTGKRLALKLEPQPTPAVPTPAGFSASARQPVALTVSDEHERKVFEATGDLTCG